MPSLDEIEGDAIEVGAWIVLLILVMIPLLTYLGLTQLRDAIPISWYPQSIWMKFSDWIDGLFYGSTLQGGQSQQWIDKRLASVDIWLMNHTPDATKSAQWADYESKFQSDNEAKVDLGTLSGLELTDYQNVG